VVRDEEDKVPIELPDQVSLWDQLLHELLDSSVDLIESNPSVLFVGGGFVVLVG